MSNGNKNQKMLVSHNFCSFKYVKVIILQCNEIKNKYNKMKYLFSFFALIKKVYLRLKPQLITRKYSDALTYIFANQLRISQYLINLIIFGFF